MLTRMDLRATYRQMSMFIDQSDMHAITTASGMAGISPILAIALGIVSMIWPICRQQAKLLRRLKNAFCGGVHLCTRGSSPPLAQATRPKGSSEAAWSCIMRLKQAKAQARLSGMC